jgi:cysteine desulfurase
LSEKRVIYLDYNASAPPREEVLEAALPYIINHWGNSSSTHSASRKPREALEKGRRDIAAWAGVKPSGVIFTSGATEANHLALRGCNLPGRVAVSAVEHPSIMSQAIASNAFIIAVDESGVVRFSALKRALKAGVKLVSVMAANNETGVIQPITAIAEIVHASGALLHVDASQIAGRWKVHPGWDLLTVSGHKAGGLKGSGALIIADGIEVVPQQVGGSQERGLRAGTVDVAGAVSLATVLLLDWPDMSALRESIENCIEAMGGLVTAKGVSRLPNTVHFSFVGIPGDSIVMGLDLQGVCSSTGSACSSGSSESSYVLESMGMNGREGVRLSLGYKTTSKEVEAVINALESVVTRQKSVLL